MGGIVVESGRFDWEGSGKFPFLTGPDPAYHGLDFIETFGDFGFSMKARAVALRDLGPALSPTNAFHILTGTETLPLRMERHVANARRGGRVPRRASGGRLGVVRGPAVQPVPRAGRPVPAARAGLGLHVRGPGRLRGGHPGRGVRRAVVASGQRRRHPEPHPPSRVDDPSAAVSDDERLAAGAGPDVIRLSVGIETVEDLIADLDRALQAAAAPTGAAEPRASGTDMTRPAGLPAGLVVSSHRARSARLGGYSTRTCMN